ncbi:hypothetical protein EV401DRAFT_1884037 [Pisolithus croceorrhizus]|nr:hypothetical protein EV401DRAFT_1884037 [Pisolithus croceorrhizus]
MTRTGHEGSRYGRGSKLGKCRSARRQSCLVILIGRVVKHRPSGGSQGGNEDVDELDFTGMYITLCPGDGPVGQVKVHLRHGLLKTATIRGRGDEVACHIIRRQGQNTTSGSQCNKFGAVALFGQRPLFKGCTNGLGFSVGKNIRATKTEDSLFTPSNVIYSVRVRAGVCQYHVFFDKHSHEFDRENAGYIFVGVGMNGSPIDICPEDEMLGIMQALRQLNNSMHLATAI